MASLSEPSESSRRQLFQIGGASMLVVAFLFILLIVLSAYLVSLVGLTPTSSINATILESLVRNEQLAQVAFGFGILSDLFMIPAVVALYVALKQVNPHLMLMAVPFVFLYIILDLAVTGLSYVALVAVSQSYVGSAASQASNLAVANYIKDMADLSQPLSSAVLSVGVLLSSLVMKSGVFRRSTAYVGVASGIVGIVYGFSAVLPELWSLIGLSALFEMVWFWLVGFRLVKLR